MPDFCRRRSGIALFEERVATHVIAVYLPESRPVRFSELQAADPLGALPGVQVRNDQTHRTAVIPRERLTVAGEGEDVFGAVDVVERQVGRVSAEAVDHHGLALRPGGDVPPQPRDGYPLPLVCRPAV